MDTLPRWAYYWYCSFPWLFWSIVHSAVIHTTHFWLTLLLLLLLLLRFYELLLLPWPLPSEGVFAAVPWFIQIATKSSTLARTIVHSSSTIETTSWINHCFLYENTSLWCHVVVGGFVRELCWIRFLFCSTRLLLYSSGIIVYPVNSVRCWFLAVCTMQQLSIKSTRIEMNLRPQTEWRQHKYSWNYWIAGWTTTRVGLDYFLEFHFLPVVLLISMLSWYP